TWIVRGDDSHRTTSTASQGPGGEVVPMAPSEASTVAPGPPGTVAVGGTTSSTARSGPVRVAAGAGAVTVSWDAFVTRPAVQSYVVRATEEGAGGAAAPDVAGLGGAVLAHTGRALRPRDHRGPQRLVAHRHLRQGQGRGGGPLAGLGRLSVVREEPGPAGGERGLVADVLGDPQ